MKVFPLRTQVSSDNMTMEYGVYLRLLNRAVTRIERHFEYQVDKKWRNERNPS